MWCGKPCEISWVGQGRPSGPQLVRTGRSRCLLNAERLSLAACWAAWTDVLPVLQPNNGCWWSSRAHLLAASHHAVDQRPRLAEMSTAHRNIRKFTMPSQTFQGFFFEHFVQRTFFPGFSGAPSAKPCGARYQSTVFRRWGKAADRQGGQPCGGWTVEDHSGPGHRCGSKATSPYKGQTIQRSNIPPSFLGQVSERSSCPDKQACVHSVEIDLFGCGTVANRVPWTSHTPHTPIDEATTLNPCLAAA